MPNIDIRIGGPRALALETTVLTHGLPRHLASELIATIRETCSKEGVLPAFTGLLRGVPTVGLTDDDLQHLLDTPETIKVNTSNFGLAAFRGDTGATTVSTTLELAASAGIRMAATGGIGGVHRGLSERLDISADLLALTRHPVAIVASGAKSVLDVVGTRELLETLGVPVIGLGSEAFPAFYLAESGAVCDGSFTDLAELARFIAYETIRSGRGLLISNPAPNPINPADWDRWLSEAGQKLTQEAGADAIDGREATPRMLAIVHELSEGQTIAVNVALLLDNVAKAAQICSRLGTSLPSSTV